MRLPMRIPMRFAAAVIFLAVSVPGYAGTPWLSPNAALRGAESGVRLANSVSDARALRKSKHKWTKRELRKGYWQECGYDGYCTTIYN